MITTEIITAKLNVIQKKDLTLLREMNVINSSLTLVLSFYNRP